MYGVRTADMDLGFYGTCLSHIVKKVLAPDRKKQDCNALIEEKVLPSPSPLLRTPSAKGKSTKEVCRLSPPTIQDEGVVTLSGGCKQSANLGIGDAQSFTYLP